MPRSAEKVAVIIAAYKAEDTIGVAISCALAQAEVGEVVVVDDASPDKTAEAAFAAGNGDPRLKVLRQERNLGPSAARNRAIAESTSPYIAILDADDALLPGRFKRMLSIDRWDFCADNIVFVGGNPLEATAPDAGAPAGRRCTIGFEDFVAGNISGGKVRRGELGFLKPVMRREFLREHGLRYDEACRLGEDFLLYAEALAKGACFVVIESCGYAAQVRENSLSGLHAIDDLRALRDGDDLLLRELDLNPQDRRTLAAHRNSIQQKVDLREVLEIRRKRGVVPGVISLLSRPKTIRDILRDKFRPVPLPIKGERLLISEDAFTQMAE